MNEPYSVSQWTSSRLYDSKTKAHLRSGRRCCTPPGVSKSFTYIFQEEDLV
nr:MAG TPA: hypothetical protein [Bacteriophage sp.]